MGKFIDMTGRKFGMLTVLERTDNVVFSSSNQRAAFICKCDCGRIVKVTGVDLRRGQKSCGCLVGRKAGDRMRTHGMSHTKLHNIWLSMKARCYRESCKDYPDYGGRGISVCEQWKNDFLAFKIWCDNNGYKEGLSIDRIDVDGNYCPENCRWADWYEQANNRRDNHFLEYKGEKHTVMEWSRIKGIHVQTILSRIRKGWSVEDTLELKPGERRKKWNLDHTR